jgi:hypothetical protein
LIYAHDAILAWFLRLERHLAKTTLCELHISPFRFLLCKR